MMRETMKDGNVLRQRWMGTARVAVALVVALLLISQTAAAQGGAPKIVHDAEY